VSNKAIHAFGTILKMGDSGTKSIDEVVLITVDATGGTFTVTFGGQTTTAIAYNASGPVMQAALEALTSIGAGNIIVTKDSTLVFRLHFTGTLAGTNVGAVTTTVTSLTGGTASATVTVPTSGFTGTQVFATIAELKSVPIPQLEAPRIDVSTHDNAQFVREYVNNMTDLPAVTFEINYLPNNPTHDHKTGLLSLQLSGAQADFKVFYNSKVVPPVVLTFPATVTSFRPSAPVDNVYTAQCQLQPTSAPVYGTA
jgi:hypothetical protein